MASRVIRVFGQCVLGLACTLAFASTARAGGFGLVAGPVPADCPQKDAVLIIYPLGCHGPGSRVSATAEGLVNGRRTSLPLRLIPVQNDGIATFAQDSYAVTRQWSREGVWVVVITATAPFRVYKKGVVVRTFPLTLKQLIEIGPGDAKVQEVAAPWPWAHNLKIVPGRRVGDNQAKEIALTLQRLSRAAAIGEGPAAPAAVPR